MICSLNNLRRAFALMLGGVLFVAGSAYAQESPVIFARERITITPTGPLPPIANGEPIRAREVRSYDVEVRSEDALKLEYIHTLNNLSFDTGVMIAFTAPTMIPLPSLNMATPVDALFVGDSGEVIQIYPNAVLGALPQEIMAKRPIKAFLFLKGGAVEKYLIRPHDTVTGSMFKAPPPVME